MHNSCAKKLFMTIATKEPANPAPAVRVRWWLLALGVIPLIGTAILAARLIWEQTVWTWERGPQMVGFSLAHGPGALLLLFPILLLIWISVAAVVTVGAMLRKRQVGATRWIILGLAISLLLVGELPDGF